MSDGSRRKRCASCSKKRGSSPGSMSSGAFPTSMPTLWRPWRTSWTCMPNRMIQSLRRSVLSDVPLVVHGEVREPLPVRPGHPQRSDCEDERLGTANLFVFVEPLAGRRCVEMTEQRTRLDFAQTIRWLVDEVYPQARVIRLVMDNLNTHTAASLYEAFPPEEAQRNGPRLEVHYTRHPWKPG